jgi:sarcosine oxidase gamma subunit
MLALVDLRTTTAWLGPGQWCIVSQGVSHVLIWGIDGDG